MMKSFSDSYRSAGVDVTAGYRSVELMKEHVKRTMIPGVVSGIGGFGGLFQPELSGMREPVLVSGTDGVGTKLKIAMLMDKHDTIGIDAVAMCVNEASVFPGLYCLWPEFSRKNSADRRRCGRGLRAGGLCPDRRRNGGASRHDAQGGL